jgi:hypothetical protein
MPATRSSSAGPRICGGCTSPARGPSSSRPRAVARRPRAATHPRGRRGPSPASPARARVRAGDRPGTRPHELNGASETACARSSINLAPTSPRSRGGHRDPPAPKAGARHAARGDRRVIRGPVGRDHTERVILDTTPLDSPARNSFRSVERRVGPQSVTRNTLGMRAATRRTRRPRIRADAIRLAVPGGGPCEVRHAASSALAIRARRGETRPIAHSDARVPAAPRAERAGELVVRETADGLARRRVTVESDTKHRPERRLEQARSPPR